MKFHSTRITLTAWYLAIIMLVSLSFSGFVYHSVMLEVNRGFRVRAQRLPFYTQAMLLEDADLYEDIRRQVIFQLAIVNGAILLASALGGYFLAGRTLSPIEQMVDEQKRFIGDASHELRTPLTALRTEIEVSLRQKLTPKEAREILQSNLEEVIKMQSLTSNLLSFSRYSQNENGIEKKRVSLKDVILKARENTKVQYDQKGIKLIKKLSGVSIVGNEASLIELVTILLDNAAKYSDPKKKVIAKTFRKNRQAVIEVQDFGVGIKKKDIPFIFDRFYRADSARTKVSADGYGLGLSIADRIAQLHGGRIDVVSSLGKGTTFSVIFHT